jgi:outer membrane protein assembly factor BamB
VIFNSPSRRWYELRAAPAWFGLIVFATPLLYAGDWPQILGPNRNGRAIDEPAVDPWGASKPAVLWSCSLGQGFAGPAVVGDRVVVFHRVGSVERVEARSARSGEQLWQTDFPASYRGGVNPDTGPRCVPTIHGNRVFAYGAAGDLHCIQLDNGTPLWSRDTQSDFDAREGYFGAGSTPIVAGDRLLLNVGGNGAGIVAFNLRDGSGVWKSTEEGASYSSPTAARIDDEDYVIFVTRLNAIGLDPRNGQVRFSFPFGRRGPTVNAATPIVVGDHLFVSASYGVGSRWVQIQDGQATSVWANDETMSSQYSTSVFYEGFFFGVHGREDLGVAELRCFEASSGEVQWRETGFGVASLILVEGRLLILTTEGMLLLADASPSAFGALAETRVSTHITRALPALSNGRFLFRDNDGRAGTLHCLQLSRAEDAP